jgi:hypothetical protein
VVDAKYTYQMTEGENIIPFYRRVIIDETDNFDRPIFMHFDLVEQTIIIENSLPIIYKEPYDLYFDINIDGLKNIIFNRIILHKKNETIDLTNKIKISTTHRHSPLSGTNTFSGDEILLFNNFGVIDVSEQEKKINDGYYMNVYFTYKNVDIVYNEDIFFNIEIDMMIERNNGTILDKVIEVKFIRKNERSTVSIPMFIFFKLFFRIE